MKKQLRGFLFFVCFITAIFLLVSICVVIPTIIESDLNYKFITSIIFGGSGLVVTIAIMVLAVLSEELVLKSVQELEKAKEDYYLAKNTYKRKIKKLDEFLDLTQEDRF